jgi:hypothetical protein
MAVRVADAMRRGALCHDVANDSDSIDYLAVDWFDLAALPVDEARARFRLAPKASEAIDAGSVTPWQQGGISQFQMRSGRAQAERDGHDYDTFGAALPAQ